MADRRRKGQRRKLSKFLSLLLRHRPMRFPIALDPEGYADLHEIEHILHGLPNFRWVTRTDIDAVVDAPGRRRFEITGDGRIRALYGHTAIRPTYPAVVPPDVLWHGTAPTHLEVIMAEGLRPMRRQYVHLAASPETARDIGRRHAPTPVLLRIDAAAAHAAGIAFHHPVPEIYLCAALPARYLSETSSE